MKIENKHIAVGLLIVGLLIGTAIGYILPERKTVKVVVDESKIKELVTRSNDSLIKLYDKKVDSILKTIPKQEQQIKIIYKTIEREKTLIIQSRNIDSLRESSVKYIKSL